MNTPTKIHFLILIADIMNVSVIIGSKIALSTKTSRIQVIQGLSSNKKQTEMFSF